MYKPTHTEQDYTAKYLGDRIHEGTPQYRKTKKKHSPEKRGRKAKGGRIVRKFKITLLPTLDQEQCLNKELRFFNEIYLYTMDKLSKDLSKDRKGFYHGYDVERSRKTSLYRRRSGIVPHTPKYIMNSQNTLIENNNWMSHCTYQISYRATVNAFNDAIKPQEERGFSANGNTFEAKLCYRIMNGFLHLKKFDQAIEIKETLPKGGLESIRITKEKNGCWSAVVEVLEPYDKAEDIRESRKGVLETNTSFSDLVTTNEQNSILETKAYLFNTFSNTVLKEKSSDSINAKLRCYQSVFGSGEEDLGLVNMACVAANARAYKYRRQTEVPKISKKYIALSEGFYIKDNVLHLKRWGLTIPLKDNSKLNRKWFDYIVIIEDENGVWKISGKKQKKRIFRNLSRIFVDFSWRDNIIF